MYRSLTEAARNCARNISSGVGPVISEEQREQPAVLVKEGKIDELISMLRDSDCSKRVASICSLAELGGAAKDAVPALMDSLDDREWVVRIAAITALGDIGPAASESVPSLIESLDKEDVCISAAIALGRIGPAAKSALASLHKLRARKNGFDCWCAEEAMRMIRED
jgi:hypothetical protein